MTTTATSSTSVRRPAADRYAVDVFGVQWPRYKAEAVLAALMVLALGVILTALIGGASFAPAVLTAAAAGTAVWWGARAVHARA